MANVLIQQFGKAQEVCGQKIIERNLVFIAEVRATLCKTRKGTAE